MKAPHFFLIVLLLLLTGIFTQAQVKIEYNSSNVSPHLLLKETADDFARVNFQNANSSTAFWSVMGKVSMTDTASLFRIFYNGTTSSTVPLTITGDLRLGIGISDPRARLTLAQSVDHADMGFRIMNAGATNSGKIWMNNDKFYIYSGTNSNTGLTLKTNSRIGVFTDDPQARFAIFKNSDDSDEDLFLVSKEVHLGGSFYDTVRIIEAKENGDVYIGRLGVHEDMPSHQLDVNTVSVESHPFRVQVLGETKVRVLNNGGMSIGSDTPNPPDNGLHVYGKLHVGTVDGATGYKVAIHGKVICEELTVELASDWPDYVFSPGYQIRSLAEVEQYIHKHHHLPGVPSAASIEANGIHTSEMFRVLMEKIEELTLHSIDQDHRLKEQQMLIDVLLNQKLR